MLKDQRSCSDRVQKKLRETAGAQLVLIFAENAKTVDGQGQEVDMHHTWMVNHTSLMRPDMRGGHAGTVNRIDGKMSNTFSSVGIPLWWQRSWHEKSILKVVQNKCLHWTHTEERSYWPQIIYVTFTFKLRETAGAQLVLIFAENAKTVDGQGQEVDMHHTWMVNHTSLMRPDMRGGHAGTVNRIDGKMSNTFSSVGIPLWWQRSWHEKSILKVVQNKCLHWTHTEERSYWPQIIYVTFTPAPMSGMEP